MAGWLRHISFSGIWEEHRGEEYTIFFDESFYKFFGLEDAEGDFCYGMVGVPTSLLRRFNNFMAELLDRYRNACSAASLSEFKSTHLLKLQPSLQITFVLALADILAGVGGFISGFYAPVAGLVHERIRVDLINETDAIPRNQAALQRGAKRAGSHDDRSQSSTTSFAYAADP